MTASGHHYLSVPFRRLAPLSVMLLALLLNSACTSDNAGTVNGQDPGGGGNSGTAEQVVQPSQANLITVYAAASTTLATAAQTEIVPPGRVLDLIAYSYQSDSNEPVDSGTITFTAEITVDIDQPPVEFFIGSVPLLNGRADIQWITPDSYAGTYTVTAEYAGDAVSAPSRWQFSVDVGAPDPEDVLLYAMARLNHIVNLMNSDTSIRSLFEDDRTAVPERTSGLADVLRDEFGLELVTSFYRFESGTEELTYQDFKQAISTGGLLPWKSVDLCIRTTLFLARNDDVLVVVIKGTDGAPNNEVNNTGSPGMAFIVAPSFPVAVHPGWAWMAHHLVDGFSRDSCDDSAHPSGSFPGLRSLIQANRGTRQLIITGHSLGGAMARMSAVEMAPELQPADRVYTFGAPWQGAYNDYFHLPAYEPYAHARFADHGIKFIYVEGQRDAVPATPETTTIKNWALVNTLTDWFFDSAAAVCEAADSVIGFFGGDSPDCDDIEIRRPLGYVPPWATRYVPFPSSSHLRRYRDGSPVYERCWTDPTTNTEQCETSSEGDFMCQPGDTHCAGPLYWSTDFGDNVYEQRAHWVGDYEAYMKFRLRGDNLRYNALFPPSRGGNIVQPLPLPRLP